MSAGKLSDSQGVFIIAETPFTDRAASTDRASIR